MTTFTKLNSLVLLSALSLAFVGCGKTSEPTVAEKAEGAVKEAAAKTKEVAREVKDLAAEKIVEWHLTPEEIKAELERTGRVVRSKANAAVAKSGEAIDNARVVALIKSKLVGDRQLSAREISVEAKQGTVTLTGTNTHAATSIGAAAILVAGADANLGTGALDFAGSGAQLEFANATTFTHDMTMTANGNIDTAGFNGAISGAITGAGLVNKVGTGTLTLSNASNSFLALAISDGRVDVTSEAATGGGNIIMHSGTLGLQGVSTLSNDIQVSGFGPINTINGGGAGSVALTGVISDIAPNAPRNLVLTNAGEFDIAGANTYTGTLTVQNTELVVGDANSIGANSATLVLDSGTLSSSAALTLAQDIDLVPFTTNFVGGANDLVLNGEILAFHPFTSLEVYGSGVVTLAHSGGFSGAENVIVSGTANVTGDLNALDYQVLSGGTLAGDGQLHFGTTTVQNGGIINPGDATVIDSIGRRAQVEGEYFATLIMPPVPTCTLVEGAMRCTIDGVPAVGWTEFMWPTDYLATMAALQA